MHNRLGTLPYAALVAAALAILLFTANGTPARQRAADAKRMTIASAVRARSAPSASATIVATLGVGTLLDELERSSAKQRIGDAEDFWYRVALPGGKEGWVFGGLTRPVDAARLGEAHLQLARERLERQNLSFDDWADLAAFLALAAPKAEGAVRGELELSRLLAIGNAVSSIPYDKQQEAPYKAWLAAQGETIGYSEPAGVWLVNATAFWDLEERYHGTPLGDRIAWIAAEAPLGGECEGFLSCAAHAVAISFGEYLARYPNGAHAGDAMGAIDGFLDGAVGGSEEYESYTPPQSDEERAELRESIERLRAAVAKSSSPRRDATLARLAKLRGLAG